MKRLLTLALLLTSSFCFAEGTRGGGDLCEDRIKIIRDDIKSWISGGGASALELPSSLSKAQYESAMMIAINSAEIRCVGAGDTGYPIAINGTAKVCRFDRTAQLDQITCDFTKFQSMNESDQYVLVHHELAGLANIEVPNGADSNYQVSNQISGYLEDQVTKKLVIKAPTPTTLPPQGAATLEELRRRCQSDIDQVFEQTRTELIKNITYYLNRRPEFQARSFSAKYSFTWPWEALRTNMNVKLHTQRLQFHITTVSGVHMSGSARIGVGDPDFSLNYDTSGQPTSANCVLSRWNFSDEDLNLADDETKVPVPYCLMPDQLPYYNGGNVCPILSGGGAKDQILFRDVPIKK